MDQRVLTGAAATLAGLACAAEAGLLWRHNQALAPQDRWQGYAEGLVTLGGVLGAWGLVTGERRAVGALGLIMLGGGLGTIAAHAVLAAQDARAVAGVEGAIYGRDPLAVSRKSEFARQVGNRAGASHPSRPGLPHGRTHHRAADSRPGPPGRVRPVPGYGLSGDVGGMLPA